VCIVCSAAYSAGVYVIVIGVSLSMCTVYFLLCAVLEFEQVYLSSLPTAQYYETSYMHRDTITHLAVAKWVEQF